MAVGRTRVATQTQLPIWKWLPRLVPFFLTSIIYMLHFDSIDQSIQQTIRLNHLQSPTYLSAFLKCCPMLCLIAFVAAHEDPQAPLDPEKGKLRYKGEIALGLAFGCVGDACLVFSETFVMGMVAFALGHGFYIHALGFKPLKAGLGFVIFTICAVALLVLRGGVPDPFIKNAMPIYSVFLVTMCWRAIARDNGTKFRRVGALGGILFVISDFLLVLQFQADIPYGELIVMTTYYSSQMCTALSVLDTSSILSKQD